MSQTIQTDRLRITMPWAAWCATFIALTAGVWVVAMFKSEVASGIKAANELGKAAIGEIQGLRMELKETRGTLGEHELQIREHRSRIQSLELKANGTSGQNW